MDRRTFVTLVAGICLLEPLAVRAQQTGKVFRIGLLAPFSEPTPSRIDIEGLRMVMVHPVCPSSWSTPETRWARGSWPAWPGQAAT